MGKKAPKAPDPYETAQAQGQMNRETAITQFGLNAYTQNNPWGSVNWEQTGTWEDGTPRYTQTTTLSPEQQATFRESQEAEQNLARIANDQTKFLGDYLGKGMDTSGLPALRGDFGPGFRGSIGGPFNANFSTQIGGTHTDQLGRNYTTSLGPDWATSYAGADDFSADRLRVEEALWERQAGDRQANQDRLRTQLINSGIRPGTAAWDSEMARLSAAENDSRLATLLAGGQEQSRLVGLARDAAMFGNDAIMGRAAFGNQSELARMQAQNQAALERAAFSQNAQQSANAAALAQAEFGNNAAAQQAAFANSARAQGMHEMFSLRNQPINEITALMSGSQVSNPGQMNAAGPQTGVAGVDYTGLVNQKYQADVQAHQARMGGLFGLGSALLGALPFSDERLKEDIRRVGQTDAGTPIYTYRYKGDAVRHMGVMAQDVPEARVMDPSGFYRVDYSRVK